MRAGQDQDDQARPHILVAVSGAPRAALLGKLIQALGPRADVKVVLDQTAERFVEASVEKHATLWAGLSAADRPVQVFTDDDMWMVGPSVRCACQWLLACLNGWKDETLLVLPTHPPTPSVPT